jgi:hypothetical protein
VRPPELVPPLGNDATGLGVAGAIVVVEPELVVVGVELPVDDPRLVTSPLAVDVDVWAVVDGVPVEVPVLLVGSVVLPSTPVGDVVPVLVESPGGTPTVVPVTGVPAPFVIESIVDGGMSATAGLRTAALAVAARFRGFRTVAAALLPCWTALAIAWVAGGGDGTTGVTLGAEEVAASGATATAWCGLEWWAAAMWCR